MQENIFLQEYFRIIYFHQLKNMLNILVAVLGLIDNGMSEENIEKITKSDSNFAPPFVDSLPFIIYFHSLSLIYYQ